MQSSFAEDSAERQMFIDFWYICQRYWIAENSDEYWIPLIKETDEFSMKYRDIPLASKIIISFIEQKEEDMRCFYLH